MSSPPLEPNEFADFFEAVHEKEPFPWQRRLAARVFARGWSPALDVPTGAGKTAAIDVALFHLALEAHRGTEREAAMRIVFVVDRRLVVDDAYERAEKLRRKLDEALRDGSPGDVVRRVAERLMHLSGERPLTTVRLRGGAPKDPDWARTPCQPSIVVSTVDQVGSRLLFRGYGVSDSMKPVHAGLLGADALYLLDEAHLSQPFVQTVKDTMTRGEPDWCTLRKPLSIVTLSATQTDEEVLEDLVQGDDHDHPVLGPRLSRPKPTVLVQVKASPDDDAYRSALVDHAWQCSVLGNGTASVVAIVVNRVRRARLVFDAIEKKIADLGERAGQASAALLIGRTRPLDRNQVLEAYLQRMSATADATARKAPLFVVGTQCIEAGADLDFDALVTEVAPLDCLRQRFGRLNRMGRPIEARGAVIAASEQVSGRAKPDPIYEDKLATTWALLEKNAETRGKEKTLTIDFGIQAAEAWLPARPELARHVAPRRDAPVLLPAFVEQWSCTAPIPAVDPEVSLFLHGPSTGPGDVEIVWRADADIDTSNESERRACIARVAACPPSPLEALSIPISEARRWLAGEAKGDVADLEVSEDSELHTARSPRRVLRWRGAESAETEWIGAWDLRPGDRIVVPATWGGCDGWGWKPQSKQPVQDLGSEANLQHRGRDVLRLSQALVDAELAREVADAGERRRRAGEFAKKARELGDAIDKLRWASDDDVIGAVEEQAGMPASFDAWWRREGSRPKVLRDDEGLPIALERRVSRKEGSVGGDSIAATEDDEASRGECTVSLKQHSGDVESRARSFARAAGLPDNLVHDIAIAGFLHDAGKARVEFKQWLYGGDELAALVGEALAKSGQRKLPPGARERAGLPAGARHEVASLSFALAHPKLGDARDRDLVLWLVGTHHGYGRPFFPPIEWPPPGSEFKTDLGDGERCSLPAPSLAELTAWWLDLRGTLERRYGPWGLARLEAVLRLADHRASEDEQRKAEAREDV